MDENLTPIIVALIGIGQVIVAVVFARRQNKASAEKDEAGAAEAISTSYSTLVIRLEERLEKLEKKYEELCQEYEESKEAWELERLGLLLRIQQLEKRE
jgi:TolA-binding protein